MATSAFYKFEVHSENLAKGVHQLHAAGHTLKVYLTNATPNAATNAVKADLAEITAQFGYPAGGNDIQNDISRTGAVTTVSGVDTTFTASGGSFGPFRYAVLYADESGRSAHRLLRLRQLDQLRGRREHPRGCAHEPHDDHDDVGAPWHPSIR
jgi:hypothetical protein